MTLNAMSEEFGASKHSDTHCMDSERCGETLLLYEAVERIQLHIIY